MDDDDPKDDFTLLPEGTVIYEVDAANDVTIHFPTFDDAIIFREFLRAWIGGDINLEVSGVRNG